MQTATVQHLAIEHNLNLADFETEFDPDYAILWGYFNPKGAPSFTLKLLADIRKYDRQVEKNGGSVLHEGARHEVGYYVWSSRTKGVYNLGGDLAYFIQCIERKDRAALLNYATLCIDSLYPRIQNYFNPAMITISLVQGDALGGGFEAALASDVIIAEEQSKMGLPEILFNLFPGMGAYSLLARRVGPRMAEAMMLSGNLYSATKLHEMGIVDIVASEGQGEMAVYDYVQKTQKRKNGVTGIYQARRTVSPITYEELMKITTDWVDAALRLEAKDLRMMARLVRSQNRLKQTELK